MDILVINGPNLNMLGKRDPKHYGTQTLDDVNEYIKASFPEINFTFFQSNHEGAIIDTLHAASGKFDGIVMNAGAYTHYSYAIADAIDCIGVPVAEVHLSNIHEREDFRKISVISANCIGQIAGLGKDSYIEGVKLIIERVTENDK
ncbi:MAG: type II 3-dehydroquinate dehydratase [Clostridia bacterium]|nr:type II 3-dehydroquinate dehydratase [Clostridia bacterium]